MGLKHPPIVFVGIGQFTSAVNNGIIRIEFQRDYDAEKLKQHEKLNPYTKYKDLHQLSSF